MKTTGKTVAALAVAVAMPAAAWGQFQAAPKEEAPAPWAKKEWLSMERERPPEPPAPWVKTETWGKAEALKAVSAGEAFLSGFEIPNESAGMVKDVVEDVLSYVTPEEYSRIVAWLDETAAKSNEPFPDLWTPHKASTVLGSLKRVGEVLGAVEDAGTVARIALIAGRGALEDKSGGEIVDDLVASGIGQSSVWGEAAYWAVAIGVGMNNGRTFAEAVADAFDPETAGTWSKLGQGLAYWATDGAMRLLQLIPDGEREAVDDAMLAHLREAGYGDEAEAALRAWLAMDLEERIEHPFSLKPEWKAEAEKAKEEKKKEDEKRRRKGRPCMSCMFGDLGGTCSTPTCPNYGRPHCEYRP